MRNISGHPDTPPSLKKMNHLTRRPVTGMQSINFQDSMDWLSWENCNRKAPLNTWENQGMQTLPRWSLQAYVSCNLKHVYFALLGIYIYIYIYLFICIIYIYEM